MGDGQGVQNMSASLAGFQLSSPSPLDSPTEPPRLPCEFSICLTKQRQKRSSCPVLSHKWFPTVLRFVGLMSIIPSELRSALSRHARISALIPSDTKDTQKRIFPFSWKGAAVVCRWKHLRYSSVGWSLFLAVLSANLLETTFWAPSGETVDGVWSAIFLTALLDWRDAKKGCICWRTCDTIYSSSTSTLSFLQKCGLGRLRTKFPFWRENDIQNTVSWTTKRSFF